MTSINNNNSSSKPHKKSTIIFEGQELPDTDKSREYVDKQTMYDALVERRDKVNAAKADDKPKPPVSDYIAWCFMKIAEGLAKKHYFRGYKFRDDMVNDAVLNCIKYVDSFDPEQSANPFAYFTQATYFSFLTRIEKEKTQTYIKFKSTDESIAQGNLADTESSDVNSEAVDHVLDNVDTTQEYMNDYIDHFEQKHGLGKHHKNNKKNK